MQATSPIPLLPTMTSDTPACFTDISPADVALQLHDISPANVALQLHGDSTPARQQLQQQSDTPITQPETFQQETVHTSSPDITNSAAVAAPTQQEIAHNLCPDISQQPLSENLTTLQQQDQPNSAPHSMVTHSQRALHQAAQPPCSDASADEFVPNYSTS
ncbi:hypothetical protein H0E87_030717, partial [Populus deltoides]